MKSTRFLDRRFGSLLASGGILLGVLLPGVIPMAVSADTVTTRSIEMSSSAASATGVGYTVTFTPEHAFKSIGLDFCSDSPLVGLSCAAPTGFDVSAATVSGNALSTNSIGVITTAQASANHLSLNSADAVTGTASSPVAFTLNGIANPTSTGPLYARIYTYAAATSDWTTDATTPGTVVDSGGVAMDVTEGIGVTAAVRETMTFCVSGTDPGADCGTVTTPSLTLGESSGAGVPKALQSNIISTGDDYTQISTNAAHGAIVNMTNNNTACGGLLLLGGSACITPAGVGSAGSIVAGTAKFGMQVGTPAGGTGTVLANSNYSSGYGMNWVSGDATGVTSPYGDPIYSADAPVNNVGVPVTFGATISNDTPAGLYSATLNMIATGKF